ncbi:uncharacterized protein NEPG_02567 [Nematocida parisii ERTm1]|uniref:uncharacterized protein n=1 Tax=Nematocida parisii (strain ERTm1 / ATCC PRA-289) TaxID=881290 RepID=UPI000264BA08|nr:uncharacterized protein NEPG_02567 [Nematocida parisii ERTm1]EIJ92553.1 hypothetical protein NEPG_02567 [Nematocida parisii ERTm1]|eukprot:XP_013060394.1 hypothetical protein NEPG_02567 [Nematocida parisii ERTm1]
MTPSVHALSVSALPPLCCYSQIILCLFAICLTWFIKTKVLGTAPHSFLLSSSLRMHFVHILLGVDNEIQNAKQWMMSKVPK